MGAPTGCQLAWVGNAGAARRRRAQPAGFAQLLAGGEVGYCRKKPFARTSGVMRAHEFQNGG